MVKLVCILFAYWSYELDIHLESTLTLYMQVRFDCGTAAEMSAGGAPPVLFCTGDGVLARTAAPASSQQGDSAGFASRLLYALIGLAKVVDQGHPGLQRGWSTLS